MDISIIIVNYKSKEKTLACLNAIKEADLDGLLYEIIVVDNASEDDSGEVIKREYKEIKFIQSEKNSGMGSGNNLGIKTAQAEFVLILNPDTIVKKDAIKILYNYIKNNKQAGIVGPKLLNSDGTLQYSCLRFPKFYTPILRRTFLGRFADRHINGFLMKDFNHDTIREVDWIMGSCLIIRKNILDKIKGGFDNRFFMYFEDTDLCRRAWQAGFKVVYNPLASAVHDHARASAESPWYLFFLNKLSRAHIASWIKYFYKWGMN
ncbi:glycosyltransferase family 2 protein [Candidatus Parcubacteria bacterium]|nr:glycosyltransferase family 2 protein [Candidatus Parcubacteria bacterium]